MKHVDYKKGFGLFTTKPIQSGTFICEYVGEVYLTRNESYEKRRAMNLGFDDYTMFVMEQDKLQCIINNSLIGNVSRFINHDCQKHANLRLDTYRSFYSIPRVALFATRDIEANEELSFTYKSKFSEEERAMLSCSCPGGQC